jgi:superfamily II DNA or RNA helicase
MPKIKVKEITLADKIYIKEPESLFELRKAFEYSVRGEKFSTLEEHEDYFTIPSNAYHKLEWESLVDNRAYKVLPKELTFMGTLRPNQVKVVNEVTVDNRPRSAIIEAPCSFGKTFVGCYLLAQANVKSLILVNTVMLATQWKNELAKLIPDATIGLIGDGDYTIGDITIGIYKSVLNKIDNVKDIFSLVIIDECHHIGAQMFTNVLHHINAKIKIGLSATPSRRDGRHVIFPDFFTPLKVVGEDDEQAINDIKVSIITTDIPFKVSHYNVKKYWGKALTKLASDTPYLNLIAGEATRQIHNNRCILILADRIEMLQNLNKLIPQSVIIMGSTSNSARDEILNNAGIKYKCLLSTTLFDEGISCHRLDTLYLVSPCSGTNRVKQRIGRIQRHHPDKEDPLVMDFWLKGPVVESQQKSRKLWYLENGYNVF